MPTQTGSPYSCITQQDAKRVNRACNQEGDKELARISTHVFIEKGLISRTLWNNARLGLPGAAHALAVAITAAELACKAFVIRNASGSYDGGSPVNGTATGRATEQVTSTKHVITGRDPEYVGNESFWENLRNNARKYDYLGGTSASLWAVLGQSLAIDFKPAITDTPTDAIASDFTVTYNQLKPILSARVDMDELNDAPFLPYTGLTATANNDATLTSTESLERIAVGTTQTAEYTAKFTGAVDYSIRPEGGALLPEGISIRPDTGVLSWTPAAGSEGVYTVFLKAENACGVLGEVELEITVS